MDKIVLFSTEQGVVLIQLIIAHIVGDFMLQTNVMAHEKKWNNLHMATHILIISIITLLFTRAWLLSLVVSVLHYAIDSIKPLLKTKKSFNTAVFIIDQLAHFLVIIIAWVLFCQIGIVAFKKLLLCVSNYNFILILSGYLLLIYPAGYLIGLVTKKQDKNAANEQDIDSGGRLIGIFERIIILTLVFLHQYEAIGFLITGKSIIRFADKNSTLKSEYVLIGTMMSYAIAILMGVIINYLMI